jgi:hypothetical protein
VGGRIFEKREGSKGGSEAELYDVSLKKREGSKGNLRFPLFIIQTNKYKNIFHIYLNNGFRKSIL